jgi:hypothetical protein
MVAFDSWLRANLIMVLLSLAAIDFSGLLPATAINAAFGVCTMLLGTTYVVQAATMIRARAVFSALGAPPVQRSLFKSTITLFLGCWLLSTGAIIFIIAQQVMAMTDRPAAQSPQHPVTALATRSPAPPMPYRKPHP